VFEFPVMFVRRAQRRCSLLRILLSAVRSAGQIDAGAADALQRINRHNANAAHDSDAHAHCA
jgi:hypothetical protein